MKAASFCPFKLAVKHLPPRQTSVIQWKNTCSRNEKIDKSVESKYLGRSGEEEADQVDEYCGGKTWFVAPLGAKSTLELLRTLSGRFQVYRKKTLGTRWKYAIPATLARIKFHLFLLRLNMVIFDPLTHLRLPISSSKTSSSSGTYPRWFRSFKQIHKMTYMFWPHSPQWLLSSRIVIHPELAHELAHELICRGRKKVVGVVGWSGTISPMMNANKSADRITGLHSFFSASFRFRFY